MIFQEVYEEKEGRKKWKNFVEHRAFLIVAVVLVVCSKIVSSVKKDFSVGLRILSPIFGSISGPFRGNHHAMARQQNEAKNCL